MTEFLDSKYFEKAKKGNSAKEIAKRWSTVTRKMTNEFRVVNLADGTIHKNFWGEAATAAKRFFADDPTWFSQLKITATQDRGTNEVFSPNYQEPVTTYQLAEWIEKAWAELNRTTVLQRVGNIMKQQFPGKDVSVQLTTISDDIRERIGPSIEVLLPVRIPGTEEVQHALVEISQLITVFKLASAWTDNNPRFWEVMERENMDKKLMPDDIGGTPVTAQNLAATITSVRKVLVAEENSTGEKGQGLYSVTSTTEDADELLEIQVKQISEEEVSQLKVQAFRAWKRSHPDSAMQPSDKQLTTLRKRNKKLYERDSESKRCGRRNCDDPKACFTHRERQAKKTDSLYILLSCPTPKGKANSAPTAKKKRKDEDTVVIGRTPYTFVFSEQLRTERTAVPYRPKIAVRRTSFSYIYLRTLPYFVFITSVPG